MHPALSVGRNPNEFNTWRAWLAAAGGAAALAALAFLLADGSEPFIEVIGFLLGAMAIPVGVGVFLRWNALRCPHCGGRFSPLVPRTLGEALRNPWSGRCACCSRYFPDWKKS